MTSKFVGMIEDFNLVCDRRLLGLRLKMAMLFVSSIISFFIITLSDWMGRMFNYYLSFALIIFSSIIGFFFHSLPIKWFAFMLLFFSTDTISNMNYIFFNESIVGDIRKGVFCLFGVAGLLGISLMGLLSEITRHYNYYFPIYLVLFSIISVVFHFLFERSLFYSFKRRNLKAVYLNFVAILKSNQLKPTEALRRLSNFNRYLGLPPDFHCFIVKFDILKKKSKIKRFLQSLDQPSSDLKMYIDLEEFPETSEHISINNSNNENQAHLAEPKNSLGLVANQKQENTSSEKQIPNKIPNLSNSSNTSDEKFFEMNQQNIAHVKDSEQNVFTNNGEQSLILNNEQNKKQDYLNRSNEPETDLESEILSIEVYFQSKELTRDLTVEIMRLKAKAVTTKTNFMKEMWKKPNCLHLVGFTLILTNIENTYGLMSQASQFLGFRNIFWNGIIFGIAFAINNIYIFYKRRILFRKKVNFITVVIIILCVVILNLLLFFKKSLNQNFYAILDTFFAFIIGICAGWGAAVIYNYGAELYPTHIRGFALAFGIVTARNMIVLASLFLFWSEKLGVHPLSFNIFSALLALPFTCLLPETFHLGLTD